VVQQELASNCCFPLHFNSIRNLSTGVSSQPNHPLDQYFNELIARRRAEADVSTKPAVAELEDPVERSPALAAVDGALDKSPAASGEKYANACIHKWYML